MMDVVKVKKWALPDEGESRPVMPWEEEEEVISDQ